MKTSGLILLSLLPFAAANAEAHALWTEAAEGGYRIFFGEPGEGLREKMDAFAKVGPLKVWDATGKELKGVTGDDHIFVKTGSGGIAIAATEAPDHGEGKDAWKVSFFARAGKSAAKATAAALAIVPAGGDGLEYTVRKDGKTVAEAGLELFGPTGWKRTFKASADGKIRIETPWPGTYVLEASHSDETAGEAGGKPYKGIYLAATYTFEKR